MLAMLTFAAVTAHAGIPYDPLTIPIDNRIARVTLSAGKRTLGWSGSNGCF